MGNEKSKVVTKSTLVVEENNKTKKKSGEGEEEVVHRCDRDCFGQQHKENFIKNYSLKPLKLYVGWEFTSKHEAVLLKILYMFQIQDLLECIKQMIGEPEGPIYHCMARTGFFNLHQHHSRNHVKICSKWLESVMMENTCEFRAVVVGENDVGKTSLIVRWAYNHFESYYKSNVEDCYRRVLSSTDEMRCPLEVMDTTGYEFTDINDHWIQTASAVIVVYNVTGKRDPEQVILPFIEEWRPQESNKSIIIIGTKADLRPNDSIYQENIEKILKLCKDYKLSYIETSAKENVNVALAMQYLIYNTWFEHSIHYDDRP